MPGKIGQRFSRPYLMLVTDLTQTQMTPTEVQVELQQCSPALGTRRRVTSGWVGDCNLITVMVVPRAGAG
jgi:hypothetical protein